MFVYYFTTKSDACAVTRSGGVEDGGKTVVSLV
jgi:hypothetical protein